MRNYSETIFSLATSKSKSALAVFRISGKLSIKKTQKLTKNKTTTNKKSKLCYFFDNNSKKIDQVVLTTYTAPKSYTGENMAEISCHGSIAIINKITEILINNGLRQSEPGEFTKRALMNNKLGLLQAEAINDIVNAETDNQRVIAINNLGQKQDQYIETLTLKLSKLLADVEAIIDFVDDELPTKLHNNIKEQRKNIIDFLEKTIENSELSKKINQGYKVTVLGKPNTGKSSFINFINNKDVSIVTNLPGTTTDLISSVLEISGNKFTFIDTAGIRRYKNIIEKIGIKKSLESAEKSDLNLVFLKNNEKKDYANIKNKIFIRSKFDKDKTKTTGVVNISSITGYGIKSLLSKISKKTKNSVLKKPTFSRERHIASLKKSLFYIKNSNISKIDIFAENIRISIKSIEEINQKFDIEKILDIIFSDFCIGK